MGLQRTSQGGGAGVCSDKVLDGAVQIPSFVL